MYCARGIKLIGQSVVSCIVERKVHPITCLGLHRGAVEWLYCFFNPKARWGWVGGQRHAPAAFSPGKGTGTHCTGGGVGPRADLGGFGGKNFVHAAGFEPRAVQPVASRCTD